MVRSFRKNAHLLKELNKTYLILIPKKANQDSISHYIPINLCYISAKIISKLLTNRLSVVLPKIIFAFQSAFITTEI